MRTHFPDPEAVEPLTPRQLDVLRLVADGRTAAEIGAMLGLSPHTVRNYLDRIYDRLKVRDRTSAVALALRNGLLD
ncbi:MAG TPA: LuxR C-terminal-related transcriptional regulator [Actinomycetota bacterium]|nr:LuxR C-terminal-related transcriptional regulator [Actinomycetota bacterium]